jgi:hypothetical protein
MGRFARNVNIFFSALAVFLAVGVVAGIYYIYVTGHRQEKADAGRAVNRAQALAGRVEQEDAARRYAGQLSAAKADVQDARASYKGGRYKDARASAEKALSVLRPIEGELETPREMPSIKAVAGSLSIISPSGSLAAKEGANVVPGDRLISGGTGTALLDFPNQEQVYLRPNSSLRLNSITAGRSGSGVDVTLLTGSLLYRSPDIVSADATGLIHSGGADVSLAPGSVCLVVLRGGDRTDVQVRSGGATVGNASGSRELKAGVDAVGIRTTAKTFETDYALAIPPAGAQPIRGRVFRTSPGRTKTVRLDWERALNASVRVQVSKSPLFSGPLALDKTVSGSSTTVGGLAAGFYFWRLRSVGGNRDTFWSWPIWFRVLEAPLKTQSPPGWRLSADATVLGDVVLVRGKVSPVVYVTVNDVQVDVNKDGTFSRTFSLAGPAGKKQAVTVCAFDGTGNEKCWSKDFQ